VTAWNETQDGVNLNNQFEGFRNTYQSILPGHLQSLITLAARPITG
jgi:hypothetical protein